MTELKPGQKVRLTLSLEGETVEQRNGEVWIEDEDGRTWYPNAGTVIDEHGSLALMNYGNVYGNQLVAVFHASQWVSCRQREYVVTTLTRDVA